MRIFDRMRVVDSVAEGVPVCRWVWFTDQHGSTASMCTCVRAISIEVLRHARKVHEVVEELAVVGLASAEPIIDHLVTRGDHDKGGAETELVELRQGRFLAGISSAREGRGGFA